MDEKIRIRMALGILKTITIWVELSFSSCFGPGKTKRLT